MQPPSKGPNKSDPHTSLPGLVEKQPDPSEILDPPKISLRLLKWALILTGGVVLFFGLLVLVLYFGLRGLGNDGFIEPQGIHIENQTEMHLMVDVTFFNRWMSPGGVMTGSCGHWVLTSPCEVRPGETSKINFEPIRFPESGDIHFYAWEPKLSQIVFVDSRDLQEWESSGWQVTVVDQR